MSFHTIAVSGVLRQLPWGQCLTNDYPLMSASFVRKTTDKLRQSRRALATRCMQSSFAFLVSVVRSFLCWISGNCATLRVRVAQGGEATSACGAHSSGSVSAMNVPGYRSSGAPLCCELIHEHRLHIRRQSLFLTRCRCRTVCMARCKTSGKVPLVSASNCVDSSDRFG